MHTNHKTNDYNVIYIYSSLRSLARHPSADDDQLAVSHAFLQMEAVGYGASGQQLLKVMRSNSSYLKAFCWVHLPDYVP